MMSRPLVAQISNVPPEIIRYFSAPNPETLPAPDIEQLAPFVDKAVPLALGVFGVQLFHVRRCASGAAALPGFCVF